MNRPRLFLSAVSEELRTARKDVAATVRTLGFDPVSQDDFPTGQGELGQWLRRQLDSCEGVIQLVGRRYGAEPPTVDPAYGRISYTQFELLYAIQHKKKTWVIVIGPDFPCEKPGNQLDLPREADHPDPVGYQAERFALQQRSLARLKRENHLRHSANNRDQMELIVRRLQDELGKLHRPVGRMAAKGRRAQSAHDGQFGCIRRSQPADHRKDPSPPAENRRGNPSSRTGRGRHNDRLEATPGAARRDRPGPCHAAVPHRGAGRILCRDRRTRHGDHRVS